MYTFYSSRRYVFSVWFVCKYNHAAEEIAPYLKANTVLVDSLFTSSYVRILITGSNCSPRGPNILF